MSRYHEVEVWQSEDNTWSVGFYSRVSMGGGEDYDSEWDDDFDHESFEYARGGYDSPESALKAAPYPNPGGHNHTDYSPDSKSHVDNLNELAWAYRNPAEAEKQKEARDLAWRKESILSMPLPPLDQRAIIKEFDRNHSGLSYTGYLRKGEDGGLYIESQDYRGNTKKTQLMTPDGEVVAGNKVSGVEQEFRLPTGMFRAQSPSRESRTCGAYTPTGPCTRTTYDYHCWQHR